MIPHPSSWRFTAEVLSGGGRDKWGDPLPETSALVEGCLLAPQTSSDPADFSAFVTDKAVLYAPSSASFTSVSRVRTPAESPLPGLWAVDGSPVRWPAGWAVPLRREAA